MKHLSPKTEMFDSSRKFRVLKPMLFNGISYESGDFFPAEGVDLPRLRKLYDLNRIGMAPSQEAIGMALSQEAIRKEAKERKPKATPEMVVEKPKKRGRPRKIRE